MSGSSAARSTARRLPARIASQFARAEELNPRMNAFTHLYSASGEAIRRAGSLAGADSKSVQMQRRNSFQARKAAHWTGSASASKTCSRPQMRRQQLALPELCEVSMDREAAVLLGALGRTLTAASEPAVQSIAPLSMRRLCKSSEAPAPS